MKQRSEWKRGAAWVLSALAPLGLALCVACLSQGKWETAAQLWENQGALGYSVIVVALLYGVATALTGRTWIATLLVGVLLNLLSLVEFFKFQILHEHFLPSDLYLSGQAGSFLDFLGQIEIPAVVWWMFLLLVLYAGLQFLLRAPQWPDWRKRVAGVLACAGMLYMWIYSPMARTGYLQMFGISANDVMDQNAGYEKNGFLPSFCLNLGQMAAEKPENYSKATMQAVAKEFSGGRTGKDFEQPDVIVVLSEAFWDPSWLPGTTFSRDPLENFHRIQEENHGGKMVSISFGGGTARPEFEVLTSMTLSGMPGGCVPYQQYVKRKTWSYARLFGELGYRSVGVHTYGETFYGRSSAYALMGYDDFYGIDDLHVPLQYDTGPFVTDETLLEEMIYQLEEADGEPLYLTAISMGNHGLYEAKYDPQQIIDTDLEVYNEKLDPDTIWTLRNLCEGISQADEMLGQLYDYVMERERPTVVLWFGDHLPALGANYAPYTTTGMIHTENSSEWTVSEKMKMFSTPYLVFSNYDTGREYQMDGEAVSPDCLMPLVCDYIGAPENELMRLVWEKMEACPVYNYHYRLFSPDRDVQETERLTDLHRCVTYDQLVGGDLLGLNE